LGKIKILHPQPISYDYDLPLNTIQTVRLTVSERSFEKHVHSLAI